MGKDVFLAAAVLFTICLVLQQRASTKLFNVLLGISAAYLAFHLLLWVVNPDVYQRSALLGTIYNVRLAGFLLLGYGAVLLHGSKFVFSSVIKLILVVSVIVAALGVLQYFLPKDVLTHVGYGLDRGARPAFFIDDNHAYPRIMSTLREPNALGAYLVMPLALVLALLLRARQLRRKILYGGALALYSVAVFLTFSRSSWLGSALAVGIVIWWQYSTLFVRFIRRWWPLALVAVLCVASLGFLWRDSHAVKSYITHSADTHSAQNPDSNGYHWILTRRGIEGVARQPLGHGPGTAGIVSIQNPNGAFLTENYYVQIAYEVGVLGLALFVALSIVVYGQIYRRRNYLSAVLLASFWAYVLTNMLLHTWSNEAVAAQWWIFAGLLLADTKLPNQADAKKH